LEPPSRPVKYLLGRDRNGRQVYTKYDHAPILADMRAQKLLFIEIARKHGVPRSLINNLSHKHGILSPLRTMEKKPNPRFRPHPLMKEFITLLYKQNLSALSEKAGYERSTLYNWRRGNKLATLSALYDVAQVMGYELSLKLEPIHAASNRKANERTGRQADPLPSVPSTSV
jgi:hypothetical protein